TVNIPAVKDTGGKVLNAMATATPQITGESVQTTLEVLDKVGVKDNIEEAIRNIDKDTPEQREEEKRITRRIYRVELLLKIFNLLYQNISPVGKISGVTISLQIILFIISNTVVLFYRKFHPSKQSPAGLQGPIYYNGILKVFNVLRPKVESYDSSVKKLDAQFSQILGTISQILIIIAASLSASSNITSLNGTSDSGTVTSFPTRLGGFVQIENNQVEEESIAVKHAAGFAKTTLLVAVLAIIMTSIMNVISWVIGILELGKKNTLTSPNVQTLIDNTIS
ncbi:8584_t:CDS:2, partial [Entrophospora sp. SA101]